MNRIEDMSAWKVFLSLTETGNFSITASELGVEPSTVSRTLTSLETALGGKLFNRTSRPMLLTEFGEKSRDLMRPVVAAHIRVADELLAVNANLSGTIRLSVGQAVGATVLMPILVDFNRLYPKVEFRVVGSGSMRDLLERTADVGCVSGRTQSKGIVYLPRGPNYFVPVASREYVQKHGLPQTPEELQRHIGIIYDGPTRKPTVELTNGRETASVSFGSAVRIPNVLAIREQVLAGYGICTDMPLLLCVEDILAGEMVPVLDGWYRKPILSFVAATESAWNQRINRLFMVWLQRHLQNVIREKEQMISGHWKLPMSATDLSDGLD